MYLIKSSVTNIVDVIESKHRKDAKNVKIPDSDESIFVIKDPQISKPDWFDYFSGSALEAFLKSSMTNPSAILVVKFGTQYFALTFGHGRFLINPYSTVADFGLRTCLNKLTGDKIKTVDSRTFDQVGLHTRQQVSDPQDFNNFSIDVEKDLVKAVDGHLDTSIGTYMKGSTCLTIVTSKNLLGLNSLCAELLSLYRKKAYEKEFAWIDNIKFLTDPSLIDDLNVTLVQKIANDDLSEMQLGAPEITDDSEIKHYKFTGLRSRDIYSIFPSIHAFAKSIIEKIKRENDSNPKLKRKLEVNDMFSSSVVAIDREDKASLKHSWKVFQCISAEIQKAGKTFKLLEGHWYEVDANYLDKIERQIKGISQSTVPFPNMNLGEREEDYNIRASATLNAICMDQDFVRMPGRSKFEFCDIFTKDKHIVHVKKHLGAAAISHLLNQGYVSAQMFSHDLEVRKELSQKDLVKGTSYVAKMNPSIFNSQLYEIVFVIASEKVKSLSSTLSFFSKITLAHKHKILTGMGYKVSCKIIQIK